MRRSTFGMVATGLLTATLALAGCSNGGDDGGSGGDATSADAIRIGVMQIVEHPSLDAAREGFEQAFVDAGYVEGTDVVFDEQNAQGDQATATAIAGTFASDNVDMVLAIATPTAQAAAQAITDKPILITAVTEPKEAGLVDSWDAPGGNVTGTSDKNPVAEQLSLVKELAPDATTVGIVYSSGEVNSQVQVDMAQEAATDLGLELKLATVSSAGEVQQAAESLDVDAFYVPTDNAVVSALESLIQVAEAKQVPVIAAEGDSVERGAVATYGIDYSKLGYQTGLMAIDILENGADPATMPIQTQDELQLVVNTAAAERMGVTIPQALVDRADTVISQ